MTTTTFPPCHRCGDAEDQHHDYDGGCLVESCDCWSFSIPPQPEPTNRHSIVATRIPIDACICEGRVTRPRSNCWADTHDLKVQPIDDEQGYQRLVEHLDDVDLADGFFGDS